MLRIAACDNRRRPRHRYAPPAPPARLQLGGNLPSEGAHIRVTHPRVHGRDSGWLSERIGSSPPPTMPSPRLSRPHHGSPCSVASPGHRSQVWRTRCSPNASLAHRSRVPVVREASTSGLPALGNATSGAVGRWTAPPMPSPSVVFLTLARRRSGALPRQSSVTIPHAR